MREGGGIFRTGMGGKEGRVVPGVSHSPAAATTVPSNSLLLALYFVLVIFEIKYRQAERGTRTVALCFVARALMQADSFVKLIPYRGTIVPITG